MSLKIMNNSLSFIDTDQLRSLARKRGGCLSVLLPATRPGTHEGNKLVVLKSLLQAAGVVSEMAKQMQQELVERGLIGGGPGLALYGGEDDLAVYQTNVGTAKVVEGDCCFVLPLLVESRLTHDFLILGLSRKMLRLLQFESGTCRVLDLPAGMPASLEESTGVESSDMKVKNHAPGGAGSVHFATSSAHEDSDSHLEHWFGRVDEAIAPMIGKQSLMLMGTDDEVASFRRVAKHSMVFEGQISHGINDTSLGEIAQMAGECALFMQVAEGANAVNRIRKWKDRSLVATDTDAAHRAAKEGRVQILCVSAGAQDEDLLNDAVVETLRHGGEVHCISAEEMSPWCPVMALLRY